MGRIQTAQQLERRANDSERDARERKAARDLLKMWVGSWRRAGIEVKPWTDRK